MTEFADRIPAPRPAFDPDDCAFCAAPALRRLPDGADSGCPIHGEARPVPTTRQRLDDARSHALEVERDDLRIQVGRLEADNRAMMRDRDQALAERDEARRTITAQTAQLRANRTLLDRLRELGELTDRAWAEHDTNADREYAALSHHDAVCPTCHLLKIDHTDGPCRAALGSPSPRAQDDSGTVGYEIVAHALHRDGLGALVSGDVVASAVSTRPTLAEAVDELRRAIGPAEREG